MSFLSGVMLLLVVGVGCATMTAGEQTPGQGEETPLDGVPVRVFVVEDPRVNPSGTTHTTVRLEGDAQYVSGQEIVLNYTYAGDPDPGANGANLWDPLVPHPTGEKVKVAKDKDSTRVKYKINAAYGGRAAVIIEAYSIDADGKKIDKSYFTTLEIAPGS
jgi:hypothetical protein